MLIAEDKNDVNNIVSDDDDSRLNWKNKIVEQENSQFKVSYKKMKIDKICEFCVVSKQT